MLDAAVRVLARGGSRPLTHRAVDVEAGVPAGTTSNHFRSRLALLTGTLAHISDLEAARLVDQAADPAADPAGAATAAGLARDGGAMIDFLLGPGRPLALARHALFLEAVRQPQLGALVGTMTRRWWDLLEARLAAAGAPDAPRQARHLLAYVDGLVVDQLIRPDPSFDAEAALGSMLRGILP